MNAYANFFPLSAPLSVVLRAVLCFSPAVSIIAIFFQAFAAPLLVAIQSVFAASGADVIQLEPFALLSLLFPLIDCTCLTHLFAFHGLCFSAFCAYEVFGVYEAVCVRAAADEDNVWPGGSVDLELRRFFQCRRKRNPPRRRKARPKTQAAARTYRDENSFVKEK